MLKSFSFNCFAKLATLGLLALVFVGCTKFYEPIVEWDKSKNDKELLGTWYIYSPEGQKGSETLVKYDNTKRMIAISPANSTNATTYSLVLTKINGQKYLSAQNSYSYNSYYLFKYVVDKKAGTLVLMNVKDSVIEAAITNRTLAGKKGSDVAWQVLENSEAVAQWVVQLPEESWERYQEYRRQ